MDEANRIINSIKSGNIAPVYFLMGEEPYFIDLISDYLEAHVLTEVEKGFNQMVFYGRDTDVQSIISNAKRFPMMSEKQLVIIKEAQDLSRSIENLIDYVKNPQPSTVLVLNYKLKSLDKRKALYKALKSSNAVVLESKKLYDNKVANWIKSNLNSKNYNIDLKAAHMLVEFLGNDLGKINNELSKLRIVCSDNRTISAEAVELNIGISKDFNNFELRKAIGQRQRKKAFLIVEYFSKNPKKNPFILTVTLLYSYFTQLMFIHTLRNKNPKEISSAIGVSPYFVSEFIAASANYSMKNISKILEELRNFDLKSKGVGATSAMTNRDLYNEMLCKIMD
jgi:DNA polymerase-3 subunit delta